jgi:hypothetical protein
MFNVSIFPLIQGVMVITALSCAVPPEKNSNAGDAKKKADPIDIESSQPSCIPTGANNNCSSLANSSEVDKCWVKILDSDKAKACAAKGKFYNRISKECADVATMTLKPNCTMQDVETVNGRAGYTEKVIRDAVKEIIVDIKDSLKLVDPKEEPILDQCIQTKTKDGKDFLIPIFLGKKYTVGVDGQGKYHWHAGKVCDTKGVSDCSNPSLKFEAASSTPEVLSCD